MKRQAKRLWTILLCLCMVLTTAAVPAAGADGNATGPGVHAGKTGANSLGTQTAESRKTAQTALLTGSESGQPAVLNENGGVSAQTTTAEVQTADALKQAIADADTGKTEVKLTSDITINTTLEVSRAVTLDLNGHVLQYKNNDGKKGSVIKVESNGELTITDSNKTAPHVFDKSGGVWKLADSITIEADKETVNGGIITGGTGGQIPYPSDPNNHFNGGGGIYIAGGKCTMSGGSIVGCQAMESPGGYGGGVYVGSHGEFTLGSDARIFGCTAQDGGGGCVDVATFTMKGAIASCTATSTGGGVLVQNYDSGGGQKNEFTMQEKATISGCTAGRRGGGVQIDYGIFEMIGDHCSITNCTAKADPSSNGGGVFLANNGTFNMSNGIIKACVAIDGGGVYNGGGTFNISGGKIADCSSEDKGSGLYNAGSATISRNAAINGRVFNEATLNANGGTVNGEVTNNDIINNNGNFKNKVTNNGTINGGTFEGEVSNKSGGIINNGTFNGEVINSENGKINNGTFNDNVTNDSGGTINGGTFKGKVTNNGMINDGTFNGDVTNESGGTIKDGKFNGTLTGTLIVTFNPDGGQFADSKDATQEVSAGTALKEPANPTKSGYTFADWYNGESKWDFATTVTQPITLTAKWTAVSTSGGGYYEWPQTPQISCGNGGKVVLSADGKTLTITPDAGKEIDKVLLNSKDLGAVPTVTNLKTGDKVEVSFKDKVTEPTKEELDKQVKEAVSKAALKARSVKLKDGRLQITVSSDVQDLQALGYTVKYKFYRSTRKASGYKAALEKAGTTYTTGKGTKGTRYYYKVRLMVYDKDGKLIAKSELKQCRYATRILRK